MAAYGLYIHKQLPTAPLLPRGRACLPLHSSWRPAIHAGLLSSPESWLPGNLPPAQQCCSYGELLLLSSRQQCFDAPVLAQILSPLLQARSMVAAGWSCCSAARC